jgi:hypothetical protein
MVFLVDLEIMYGSKKLLVPGAQKHIAALFEVIHPFLLIGDGIMERGAVNADKTIEESKEHL